MDVQMCTWKVFTSIRGSVDTSFFFFYFSSMMRTLPSRGKIWVMGAAPGSSFNKFPSFCLMAILFYLFSTDRPPSPLIFISRVLQILLDPSCLERRYWLIIFFSWIPGKEMGCVQPWFAEFPENVNVLVCVHCYYICGEVIAGDLKTISTKSELETWVPGECFANNHALTQWSLGLVSLHLMRFNPPQWSVVFIKLRGLEQVFVPKSLSSFVK